MVASKNHVFGGHWSYNPVAEVSTFENDGSMNVALGQGYDPEYVSADEQAWMHEVGLHHGDIPADVLAGTKRIGEHCGLRGNQWVTVEFVPDGQQWYAIDVNVRSGRNSFIAAASRKHLEQFKDMTMGALAYTLQAASLMDAYS
jgi:hypothetical protein